jgi:hypothetical protein
MDDDRRREIIEQARATLARLDRKRELERWQRGSDLGDEREDALVRWARLRQQSIEPPKPAPPPPKQRRNEMTETQVRDYVAQRLDELVAVIGDETGKADAKLAEQIRQLRIELVELRAELHETRSERSAEVLDLPNWRSDVVQH